jgi:hypothetical protein
MIIIIMRGENFVAHLDGLGGTPVAHHWYRRTDRQTDRQELHRAVNASGNDTRIFGVFYDSTNLSFHVLSIVSNHIFGISEPGW